MTDSLFEAVALCSKELMKYGFSAEEFAVLAQKGDTFHAIGFWMEHRDDYGYEYDEFAPSDVMKKYAVSIDELEKNTGLDFFCNLPDSIEKTVESTWSETDWDW